jgi:hypothetical protein
LFKDVRVQSFFYTGELQKYFVVDLAITVNTKHSNIE